MLDTRAGQPGPAGCDRPSQSLAGQAYRTETAAVVACAGIPAGAQALVGNATVVNSGPAGGYASLQPGAAPAGNPTPGSSNVNYGPGQVVANAFTVGLGGDGAFSIYAYTGVDFVVDIAGYYSADANDANGALQYYALSSPVRLLDTRSGLPAQSACDQPGTPLAANQASKSGPLRAHGAKDAPNVRLRRGAAPLLPVRGTSYHARWGRAHGNRSPAGQASEMRRRLDKPTGCCRPPG